MYDGLNPPIVMEILFVSKASFVEIGHMGATPYIVQN